jgi:hypothetical protein
LTLKIPNPEGVSAGYFMFLLKFRSETCKKKYIYKYYAAKVSPCAGGLWRSIGIAFLVSNLYSLAEG